jgi:hypothetical protein
MAQEPQSQDRAFVRQQSAPTMTLHAQQNAHAAGQQRSAHKSTIPSHTLSYMDKQAHIRNITKRQGIGLLVARAGVSPPPPPYLSLRFHNAVLSFTVMRLTNWDQSVATLLTELRTNMDAIRGFFFLSVLVLWKGFFCWQGCPTHPQFPLSRKAHSESQVKFAEVLTNAVWIETLPKP